VAEDQDQSQKTEEPTQRRLDEARQKGQMATSREVNHALILGSGALFLGIIAPGLGQKMVEALSPFVGQPQRSPSARSSWCAPWPRCSARSAWRCSRRCWCSSARRSPAA
jgi:flagellar biosynthetic protein FlhB